MADQVDETQGERCKAFWEHLIDRYPIEATVLSRRNLPIVREKFRSYAWLWPSTFPLPESGRVFVRGERGIAPAAVHSRLEPFAADWRRH